MKSRLRHDTHTFTKNTIRGVKLHTVLPIYWYDFDSLIQKLTLHPFTISGGGKKALNDYAARDGKNNDWLPE